MGVKYWLGCGGELREGHINVDLYNPVANLRADIKTMTYEPTDYIGSKHVFEHFGYVDSFVILTKWTLALNLYGVLVIDIPDIVRIMSEANTRTTQASAVRLLYGSQEDVWAYHINAWPELWAKYVLDCFGYNDIIITRYGESTYGFPNYGIIYKSTKARQIERNKIKLTAKELLGWYLHPSETELHKKYCKQYDSAIEG